MWSLIQNISLLYPKNTWGMIESLERRSLSPIFEMSIPSIVMLPQQDSMMRNKASVIEDFPAPVRPTIPIYMQKQSKVFSLK